MDIATNGKMGAVYHSVAEQVKVLGVLKYVEGKEEDGCGNKVAEDFM